MIVKNRQDEVLAELDLQQQKDKRSTLLLIDAESCQMPSPDDCPDLLLTVVRLLIQDAIRNVVPIGKEEGMNYVFIEDLHDIH